jgi:hypothetical protein
MIIAIFCIIFGTVGMYQTLKYGDRVSGLAFVMNMSLAAIIIGYGFGQVVIHL